MCNDQTLVHIAMGKVTQYYLYISLILAQIVEEKNVGVLKFI